VLQQIQVPQGAAANISTTKCSSYERKKEHEASQKRNEATKCCNKYKRHKMFKLRKKERTNAMCHTGPVWGGYD